MLVASEDFGTWFTFNHVIPPSSPGSSVIWAILVGWLCWGLTSQSTIFQSCRDGAIVSWVINQYFRGVKCLAQGHNTAEVGLEPRTSRSGVRHSTTEPPRSPLSHLKYATTSTKICKSPWFAWRIFLHIVYFFITLPYMKGKSPWYLWNLSHL